MGMEKIREIKEYNVGRKKPLFLYDVQVSGGSTYVLNGVVVHNSEVEFGISEDIPIQGDQVVTIKTHTRKGYTRKDGVYVPATIVPEHKVKYHNARLIGFRPKLSKFEYGEKIFRVIHKIKAREGQFYLSRAVQLGLENLGDDIKFCLQRVGRVK